MSTSTSLVAVQGAECAKLRAENAKLHEALRHAISLPAICRSGWQEAAAERDRVTSVMEFKREGHLEETLGLQRNLERLRDARNANAAEADEATLSLDKLRREWTAAEVHNVRQLEVKEKIVQNLLKRVEELKAERDQLRKEKAAARQAAGYAEMPTLIEAGPLGNGSAGG